MCYNLICELVANFKGEFFLRKYHTGQRDRLLAFFAKHPDSLFTIDDISESVKGIPAIRRSLFWDTDFDKIDWGRYRKGIIQRVLERGSKEEQQEIARFYNIDPATLNEYKPTNSYRMRIPENK